MSEVATLRHYCRCLCENLSLPCVAWYPEPTDADGGYPCTLVELIDPASGLGDKFVGIFCKVRKQEQVITLPLVQLEVPRDDTNYRFVECYRDWFWQRR